LLADPLFTDRRRGLAFERAPERDWPFPAASLASPEEYSSADKRVALLSRSFSLSWADDVRLRQFRTDHMSVRFSLWLFITLFFRSGFSIFSVFATHFR
jgi:hypothetical protein